MRFLDNPQNTPKLPDRYGRYILTSVRLDSPIQRNNDANLSFFKYLPVLFYRFGIASTECADTSASFGISAVGQVAAFETFHKRQQSYAGEFPWWIGYVATIGWPIRIQSAGNPVDLDRKEENDKSNEEWFRNEAKN